MAIKLGNNVFIKRGSRPTPLSKYETKDLNDINAIPYPIQSDIEKNNNYLCQYKKMFKTNLGYNFSPAIRGDLLMTSSCDIGNVVILNLEKAFIDDKFFNLKTSPLLEKQYLKYWIIKNKKEISELGYGTTFNVLYIEPFSKYLNTKFVPDLQTQQEIINIIEPFEKLKEQINNKKEAIKKICYFEIINSKPQKTMIENEIMFEKGKNINSKYLVENVTNLPFINVSAINNKINKFISNSSVKKNIRYGDIILSLDGTIGLVNNFLEGYNGYGYKVFSKNNITDNSIIYFSLLNPINQKIIFENSNGSVIKHASKTKDKILLFKFLNEDLLKIIFKYEMALKKINKKLNQIIEKLINLFIM